MSVLVAEEEWSELELTHNLCSADYYFDSRAHHSSHQDILHDHVSMGAFRKAMLLNRHLIANRTVLVVGCGLSLLPLIAAECGASAVYVHCAYGELAVLSELVVRKNLQSKVLFFVGKIEDMQLPVTKVDVIVSELVGCFLFYEAKFGDFLYARDHFLAPDGLLFPERVSLSAAGVYDLHDRAQREEQWRNFWGVDLSPLEAASRREPLIDCVDDRNLVTDEASVCSLDLYTVASNVLSHERPVAGEFALTAGQHGAEIGGVVFWFDVHFDQKMHATHVAYSTSPHCKSTVWKQTTLTLEQPVTLDDGASCTFRLAIRQAQPRQRSLEVKLGYEAVNEFYRLS